MLKDIRLCRQVQPLRSLRDVFAYSNTGWTVAGQVWLGVDLMHSTVHFYPNAKTYALTTIHGCTYTCLYLPRACTTVYQVLRSATNSSSWCAALHKSLLQPLNLTRTFCQLLRRIILFAIGYVRDLRDACPPHPLT